MSKQKKQIRQNFRNETFKRDNFTCICCKKKFKAEDAEACLDAHHIAPREIMPNGGYVKENGATLCKGEDGTSCHEKAESYIKGDLNDPRYSPERLYELINSSVEEAVRASKRLEDET